MGRFRQNSQYEWLISPRENSDAVEAKSRVNWATFSPKRAKKVVVNPAATATSIHGFLSAKPFLAILMPAQSVVRLSVSGSESPIR